MQLVGAGDESRPRAAVHAPLSVLPVPFPRASFEKAKAAMRIFNRLIDRVSRDGAYLKATLQAASEFDDFTVGASLCLSCSMAKLECKSVKCTADGLREHVYCLCHQ